MCEHCNHERELKIGDRVNVDWQKASESRFGNRSWVIGNVGYEDMKQGTIVDINASACDELAYKVKFNSNIVPHLWLDKDWLSLDESKTEKENEHETEKKNEHERKLKVGDHVNVDWQKALRSRTESSWITEGAKQLNKKQGVITYIDDSPVLNCKVKFNDRIYSHLWLDEDWLSLVDESNGKENENMFTTCVVCGCVISEENETWDGHYICDDCKDGYYYCEDCKKYVPADDSIGIDDGNGHCAKYVCPDCADDYPICVECGEHILPEGLVDTGVSGDPLCEYCAGCSFSWNRCEDCGEYHNDCVGINNEWYCQDCAENYRHCDCNNSENSEYVNNYTYKPCPKFHHSTMEEFDNPLLFMGVELEIDSDDGDADAIECAEDLHSIDYDEDFFYLKHDGSLNQPGIEIVTHPCTLIYHTNVFPWEKIVRAARGNYYSSHDVGTCGLHVHVNRDALGDDSDAQDLTIAKIVIMMDKLWDYLVKFSRRNYDQLHWARKMDASINEMDTEEEAVEKTKAAASGERYHALNLQNRNTIEFRLFRGTLKLNTIMATLQFVDGMCRYAMAHTVKECLATSWMDLANSIDYAEFQQYLRERDLTNDEQPEQDDGDDADED